MHDSERGKEIYQAILKAAYQALFSLGVKTPENVDKFILNLEANLSREFLRIGVYQLEEPVVESTETRGQPLQAGVEPPVLETTTDTGDRELLHVGIDIEALRLNNLTERRLRLAGINTIEEIMSHIKDGTLTSIKGIKDKSAAEIFSKWALWSKQS